MLTNNVHMGTTIRAKDNEPIPVRYISFGAVENSQPEFFFNSSSIFRAEWIAWEIQ